MTAAKTLRRFSQYVGSLSEFEELARYCLESVRAIVCPENIKRKTWDYAIQQLSEGMLKVSKQQGDLSGTMEALTPQIRTMYEEHALGWV